MRLPPDEQDPDKQRDYDGPSESDIERFNSEEYDYLQEQKRQARSALWKLITGGVVILFAASLILNFLVPALNGAPDTSEFGRRADLTDARVIRIIDGETIRVDIGGVERTVRYIGVELPDLDDPLYSAAVTASRVWIQGRSVQLEADSEDLDEQGRLLRYVWVDDSMVNFNLVSSGLARAIASAGNDRYEDVFQQLEDAAKSRGVGIWEETNSDSVRLEPVEVPIAASAA